MLVGLAGYTVGKNDGLDVRRDVGFDVVDGQNSVLSCTTMSNGVNNTLEASMTSSDNAFKIVHVHDLILFQY